MSPLETMSSVETVLTHIPEVLPSDHRFVIAIAGPPASGKSTLAAAIVDAVAGRAGLVALDGFHFDDTILDERGHRLRKGAKHTFDVASYAMTLQTVRTSPGSALSVPVFDRTLELSRNCASVIAGDHQIVVTEGNYLLLDEAPWQELRPLFDLTIWLDVSLDTVEKRILERWSLAGYPEAEVQRRAGENDLPNARLVHNGSVGADVIVEQISM